MFSIAKLCPKDMILHHAKLTIMVMMIPELLFLTIWGTI